MLLNVTYFRYHVNKQMHVQQLNILYLSTFYKPYFMYTISGVLGSRRQE